MAFNSYVGMFLFGTAASRPASPPNGATQVTNTADYQTETTFLDGFPVFYFATDTGAWSMFDPLTSAWIAGAAAAVSVVGAGVVFASLPASPVAGELAYITDGDSASYANGATVAGGGSTKMIVFYDGAAWRAA